MTNRALQFVLMAVLFTGIPVCGQDATGVFMLREAAPNLTGTNVVVAQAEAGDPTWEVNPAAVGQPQSLFTWQSGDGWANLFPNTLGLESGHADQVANIFYGATAGVAPGVASVDNYEAVFFYDSIVRHQTVIAARIVNQSFVFGTQDPAVDAAYDDFAARRNTLFVSGIGNGGAVNSPGTCYNGIGVGVIDAPSSFGPSTDGRSKPDLVAGGGFTSFSAPLVAGAAALLMQAASQEDGGPGTASAASDVRTIKALLLNGARKPADWTNSPATPLDARYGAGVLNVFNSYNELIAGRQTPATAILTGVSKPNPASIATNAAGVRRGWDFNTITTGVAGANTNHYAFDLRDVTNRVIRLAATLVWFRPMNQAPLRNLDLLLFDADTGTRVAASRSLVDNVEHLFVDGLPPGRYDLQVLKNAGANGSETYALAFDFTPPEPPRFGQPRFLAGQFHCSLIGDPNQSYVIQTTSDLVNWTAVQTNSTDAQGLLEFTDPQPVAGHGFYRARWRP